MHVENHAKQGLPLFQTLCVTTTQLHHCSKKVTFNKHINEWPYLQALRCYLTFTGLEIFLIFSNIKKRKELAGHTQAAAAMNYSLISSLESVYKNTWFRFSTPVIIELSKPYACSQKLSNRLLGFTFLITRLTVRSSGFSFAKNTVAHPPISFKNSTTLSIKAT